MAKRSNTATKTTETVSKIAKTPTDEHIAGCYARQTGKISVGQQVLETFAYHCGEIMTSNHLNSFSLHTPGGPEVFVTMKIRSRSEDGNIGWDQIEVNGVHVGNRSAARDEYARLCAPVLAAAFATK
jgi:hypothetical protein